MSGRGLIASSDMPTTPPLPLDRPSKPTWAILALLALLGLQSYQSVRLFPTLASIVDPDAPVVVVDHAIHEHHGSLGAGFFREHGTTWGYDPSFMAGYPETPVWDSSSNPSILFELIGGGRPGGYRAYKVGLLACSILWLAAVAAGARAAGLGWSEVAVASWLAWLSYWVGYADALWRSGLFAFVSASAGVGLLLGLCSRFDREPSKAGWSALVMAGAGLFYLHVTAPVLAIGGLLAFYATVGRRHGPRWHLAIVGAGALAVAVNLTWLVSLWRFRGIRTGSGSFLTADSARFLWDYFLDQSAESRTSLVLLVLGLAGLVGWWFGRRKGSAAAFGGSILALILLTGFGSLWGPTRMLEPVRFSVAFVFLLAVPAASTVVGASRRVASRLGGGRRGGIAVVAGWAAILGGWAAMEPSYFRASWSYLALHRPLVVGIKPEMRRLVDWLRGNTDLSGRILLEDQLRLLENTDPESVHWTPLLPRLLGADARMFVGGLYQTAFIEHHRMAAFGDFQLGDRPIDRWTSAEVGEYCRTYNVGWVACWSPLSRFWFDRQPSAVKVATLPRYSTPNLPPSTNEQEWSAMTKRAGPEVARRYMLEGERSYSVYRIDRPRSYFLKGKGRITSVGPNRVELADVEPEGGAVVLSLHWLDTWKSDPPLVLKAEPPDPVDFDPDGVRPDRDAGPGGPPGLVQWLWTLGPWADPWAPLSRTDGWPGGGRWRSGSGRGGRGRGPWSGRWPGGWGPRDVGTGSAPGTLPGASGSGRRRRPPGRR